MDSDKRIVRILSIDGGGVRGLIPLQSLKFLEQELQKSDGHEARLADYFNIVAGTSTGGLIATMLATPDPNDHPHHRPYTTGKIECFFFDNASSIFPPIWWNWFYLFCGPKYDGKHLVAKLKEELQETRLSQTVTNLVIPTFDIKTQFPAIFSSDEARKDPLKNPCLKDVCIATSAAPTYFPPHQFTTKSRCGERRVFNLVDGAVAANNPTLIAMNLVSQAVQRFKSIEDKKVPLKKFFVLSLGTGLEEDIKWDAKSAAKWGVWTWITNCGRSPLVESLMNASSDMVDFHTALLFANLKDNYLRIQERQLKGCVASMDLSMKCNLEKLKCIGEKLLDEPVCRVKLETGYCEVEKEEYTNRMALAKLAEKLSKDKKLRANGSASFFTF